MESRAFLAAFAKFPEGLASRLDRVLDRSNDLTRSADEDRLIGHFRVGARGTADRADIAVFGHVHRPVDEPGPPRLIVLGGWHRGMSFLRVDERGPEFVVESGSQHASVT